MTQNKARKKSAGRLVVLATSGLMTLGFLAAILAGPQALAVNSQPAATASSPTRQTQPDVSPSAAYTAPRPSSPSPAQSPSYAATPRLRTRGS